ncbi:class I SAM-dependent methyltransferase [Stenotrophomonas oahuensis]|uniref:Methyltransferase domain-containing protein n=1 Tax=Stenotrophomonas oahuensis TaxID=3003271 RepID=A0ABY9YNW4_9GAMM|nr:methyltransferase domain-containing protein [Stenotrophomonas sp. A5586]WNH52320.1 methyltransferase domain-containing protein [Stenotrophomonas sp. A5586]
MADTPTQTELWNGPAGHAWVTAQRILDEMFNGFATHLAQTVPTNANWRVLDVGCGTGDTTLTLARRLGPGGRATGIDLSAPMIEVARQRAVDAALPVEFIAADAGQPPLPAASIDHIVSRFGVMFFDNPVQAFTRLRETTRQGGTLHAVVWRSAADNPFMTTAERAAASLLPLPPRVPDGPGQFAFADADKVRWILESASWSEVAITPLDMSCEIARDDLRTYLSLLGPVGTALRNETLDAAEREHILDTLEAAFSPFIVGDRVQFTAACWVIKGANP